MVEEALPIVPYGQLLFTIPRRLETRFHFDRSLYGDLCRAAPAAIRHFLRQRAAAGFGRFRHALPSPYLPLPALRLNCKPIGLGPGKGGSPLLQLQNVNDVESGRSLHPVKLLDGDERRKGAPLPLDDEVVVPEIHPVEVWPSSGRASMALNASFARLPRTHQP